jgi:hypothetical protein
MSTTPSIQATTPATSSTPNPAAAIQSQSPGGWYNPFPNPYTYGFPSNGADIYGAGLYGAGMGMGMGMGMGAGLYGAGMGMGSGVINPAVAGIYGANGGINNLYGSYNYQNKNTNSALPGYNYQSAVAPTTFTAPLSGNGVDPNSSGSRIYQEHFSEQNTPLVSVASGGVGALTAGGLWVFTLGRCFRGATGAMSKAGNVLQLLAMGAGAAAGAVIGNRFLADKLKAYYTGLDYADNGNMDGSYTAQRGYDASLTKIL